MTPRPFLIYGKRGYLTSLVATSADHHILWCPPSRKPARHRGRAGLKRAARVANATAGPGATGSKPGRTDSKHACRITHHSSLITDHSSLVTCHCSPVTVHSSPVTDFRYSRSPMLDLGYVREHLDVIEKMARDRGITLDLDAFRALDTERRQIITAIERLKAERNKASEEIPRLNKIVHGGDKAKQQLKDQAQAAEREKENAAGQKMRPPPARSDACGGHGRARRAAREAENRGGRGEARRRAHRRARRAAEAVHADDSEYPARERAGGPERGGQRGSAALGRASEIRFRAEAALGNRRSGGDSGFRRGRQNRRSALRGL